ncbi:MAG TPA: DUF559 domain-containing protein [Gemmata sp.]
MREPLPPAPSLLRGGGESQVRFIVRGQRVADEKKARARQLRREQTPTERVVWELVRANRLGLQFRRQQVIDGYIADFYCHAAALVVEVDGPVHGAQIEYDERRTVAFAARGIRVIRFGNEEVESRPHEVAARIRTAVGEEPLPPAPSPKKGGGEEPTAARQTGRGSPTTGNSDLARSPVKGMEELPAAPKPTAESLSLLRVKAGEVN